MILLSKARPIGGLRMIDKNEADDKIIAVLIDDAVFGGMKDIGDVPKEIIDRLRHYFLTYKQSPDTTAVKVRIPQIYGFKDAIEVIKTSQSDYLDLVKN